MPLSSAVNPPDTQLPSAPGPLHARHEAPHAEAPSSHWWRRHALLLAALWIILLGALALGLSTAWPWAGLRLAAQDGQVRVLAVYAHSPAALAGVQPGMRLLAVSSPRSGLYMNLTPEDLIETASLLPRYGDWQRFYARQTHLSQLWAEPLLWLHLSSPRAGPYEATHVLTLLPAPMRPPHALPAQFGFVVLVQAICLLSAAWVLAMYPVRTATGYAALSAVLLGLVLMCSAVLGSRELALPGSLWQLLVTLGQCASLGALLCLAGALGHFPQRLPGMGVAPVAAVAGFFALWALATMLWWLPQPRWGEHAMLLAALALIWLQIVRQWRASAADSSARKALHALVLPWGVALTAMLGLWEGVLLWDGTPPLAQAWLYGLMAAVSVGAALALRGTRAFDLDEWAMQALLGLAACCATVLCYRLLQASSWGSGDVAMLVALLACGLVYVPLSSKLWDFSLAKRGPSPRELTGRILALGLLPAAERWSHWSALLMQSLHVRQLGSMTPPEHLHTPARATLLAHGRTLWVPPVAGLPGFALYSRDRSGRLFSRNDKRLAQRLADLAAQTLAARDAYVRGAAEERERIADDLHDDLGARLLSLVHSSELTHPELSRMARAALQEMRLSVRNLKAQPMPAADLLADWRAETVLRLAAANFEVNWDAQEQDGHWHMPVRTGMQLTRVLREAVSNVIRHSGGGYCRVQLRINAAGLTLEVEDNGRGLPADAALHGNGLVSIERRVRRLGGSHAFSRGSLGGTLLHVQVPAQWLPS